MNFNYIKLTFLSSKTYFEQITILFEEEMSKKYLVFQICWWNLNQKNVPFKHEVLQEKARRYSFNFLKFDNFSANVKQFAW